MVSCAVRPIHAGALQDPYSHLDSIFKDDCFLHLRLAVQNGQGITIASAGRNVCVNLHNSAT